MLNTEIEQAASVHPTEKLGEGEVVTSSGVKLPQNSAEAQPSNTKQPKTAYMVVRNGRPYFYATINRWDKRAKKVRTSKRYLGTSLPRGYQLSDRASEGR